MPETGGEYHPSRARAFDAENAKSSSIAVVVIATIMGTIIFLGEKEDKAQEKAAEECVAALVGHKVDLETKGRELRAVNGNLSKQIAACIENDNEAEAATASLQANP